MTKSIYIFVLFTFWGMVVYGQKVTVSGFITNASSNERIGDVYVIALPSQKHEISNDFGFFSITLEKSAMPFSLIFSNISYKQDTLKLYVQKDTVIYVKLVPGRTLDEVKISGKRIEPIEQRNETGVLSIPMKQMDMLPALGGEKDIIKAYQLMPGVQSGNEGSSSLLVRGGSNDQNLILIDDIPVYYINHLGGFVSVFNSDAINSTKLYKGGFPARYGGRLSSVFDVRMKDGNNKKFGGDASIGLLTAKFMLEGPLDKKHNSSYLISYRRFLYDLLMRPITKMIDKNSSSGYYFHDFNLKLNHTFSPKNRLYFSLYFGDDKFKTKYEDISQNISNKTKYTEQWGNFLTALRWNHLFGNKLFGNFSLYYTRYRFKTEMNSNLEQGTMVQQGHNLFFTGIYDIGLKPDFEFFLFPRYKFRFGGLITYHGFTPNITRFSSEIGNKTIINQSFSEKSFHSFETAAYLENIMTLSSRLKVNMGLRFSSYSVNGHLFTDVEPRLLVNYLIGKKNSVKVSFSKMHQNIHLLSNSGAGVPVDFWYPASENAPPAVSWQVTAGYATTLFDKFELSIEGFYKNMHDLTTFKPGASYFGTNRSFYQKIETGGTGTVYGIDFLIQKKIGNFTGWLGYTWMKNYRQFAAINGGLPYPYKYDRRNDVSIVLTYRISKKVDFSATWVYGTGQALTLPVGKYYLPDILPGENIHNAYLQEIYIYTNKNAFRTKAYHRLDIGVNFRKKKHWGERVWNLSIYNLYNRKNPYTYYFSGGSVNTPNGLKYKQYLNQQSLFPFIPSISYSIHF